VKTDRKALLWGTIIGGVLVVGVCVLTFDFPNLHLPHAGEWIGLFFVSGVFFWGIIRAYRALWKRVTFWLLLIAFLPAHVALWWFFILRLAEAASLLRESAFYAVGMGAEVLAFSLIVFWLYHRGPDTSAFTGLKVH